MDIKQEFEALNMLIEESENDFNPETGEFQDNSGEINSLTHELLEKRDDLINFLVDKRSEYKMLEGGLGDKIKKLQEKKQSAKRQQDKILDTLDFILEGEKVKTEEHTLWYAKTESVDILSQDDIPAEFITFTPKIATTELKKALKRGDEIKGAVLHEKIGIRIR